MARKADEKPNTIREDEYLRFSRELVDIQREIRNLTEQLASARGLKAGVLKRAKNAGADKDAMMMLERLTKLDPDERTSMLDNVAKYARWTSVQLWTAGTAEDGQGAMFGEDIQTEEARQAHRDALIVSDGYDSAKTGSTPDNNPHPVGSRESGVWMSGYEAFNRDLEAGRAATQKQVTTASTAPKGRKAKKAEAEVAALPAPEPETVPPEQTDAFGDAPAIVH
jgi:hypothetical protein